MKKNNFIESLDKLDDSILQRYDKIDSMLEEKRPKRKTHFPVFHVVAAGIAFLLIVSTVITTLMSGGGDLGGVLPQESEGPTPMGSQSGDHPESTPEQNITDRPINEGLEFEKCKDLGYWYWKQRLVSYSGSDTKVVIPDEYDEDAVIAIGDGAFEGRDDITEIIIPNTVVTIGSRAIAGCSGLERIVFTGNKNEWNGILKEEDWNEGASDYTVVYMGEDSDTDEFTPGLLFRLTSTQDSYNAFLYIGTGTEVVVPRTYKGLPVTKVGNITELSSGGVGSIVIPESVTQFMAWESLDNIRYGGTMMRWIWMLKSCYEVPGEYTAECADGTVTDKDSKIFYTFDLRLTEDGSAYKIIRYSGSAKELSIPSEFLGIPITEISECAFSDKTTVKKILIPHTVITLGERIFGGCASLESIEVDPDNPKYFSEGNCVIERETGILVLGCGSVVIPDSVSSIADHAFYTIPTLKEVTVPSGVVSIGRAAFYDCTGLERVTLPDTLLEIGDFAFGGCEKLKSIAIPNKITQIGMAVLSRCTELESVSLPNGLYKIGESAFQECVSLESVVIPTGTVFIGEYAFYNCTSLVSIEIPDTVEVIGDGAIGLCPMLSTIKIGSGNKAYRSEGGCLIAIDGDILMRGNPNGVIPQSVKKIGDSAFSEFSEMKSVTLHDGLTEIGSSAFYMCESLEKIVIPDSVTVIGEGAFYDCKGLADVSLGKGITCIEKRMFSGCSSLRSIIITENIKEIKSNAFMSCARLTEIYVEKGLTSIGTGIFRQCFELAVIFYSGTTEEWNAIAKSDGQDTWYGENVSSKFIIRCTDGMLTRGDYTFEPEFEDMRSQYVAAFLEKYEAKTVEILYDLGEYNGTRAMIIYATDGTYKDNEDITLNRYVFDGYGDRQIYFYDNGILYSPKTAYLSGILSLDGLHQVWLDWIDFCHRGNILGAVDEENEILGMANTEYECDLSKFPLSEPISVDGRVKLVKLDKALVYLTSVNDRSEYGTYLWLKYDDVIRLEPGEKITVTFSDIIAEDGEGMPLTVMAESVESTVKKMDCYVYAATSDGFVASVNGLGLVYVKYKNADQYMKVFDTITVKYDRNDLKKVGGSFINHTGNEATYEYTVEHPMSVEQSSERFG